jgi:protease-4
VDLGLADALGSVDYVAREVIKAETVVDFTQKENVAERLAKRFGAAFSDGLQGLLTRGSVGIR